MILIDCQKVVCVLRTVKETICVEATKSDTASGIPQESVDMFSTDATRLAAVEGQLAVQSKGIFEKKKVSI